LRRNSILGIAYFWRRICFGEIPNFGKEDLILEKSNRWKERNMQKKKEKQHARGKAMWRVGRKA
jgi:hypothetical protein